MRSFTAAYPVLRTVRHDSAPPARHCSPQFGDELHSELLRVPHLHQISSIQVVSLVEIQERVERVPTATALTASRRRLPGFLNVAHQRRGVSGERLVQESSPVVDADGERLAALEVESSEQVGYGLLQGSFLR